jgi:hypothetical protein
VLLGIAPSTRFSVLGPIRAWRGDSEIDLGSRSTRLMLALLLVRCGEPVSPAEQIELLWAGDPPERAHDLVAGHLAALERLLPPGTLRSGPDGHRLPVDDGSLDLLAFRRETARADAEFERGKPDAAVAIATDALGLWHGRCGAGLEPTSALHPAFVAVDRERAWAACTMADRAHAAGVGGGFITVLRAVAALDPLDEALALRLRTASADGAPGTAIADGMPRAAADGAPGGPPTSRSPDRAVVRPAQLPAGSRHFAGRGRELAELDQLLRAEAANNVVTIAIDGIPGVGKSALAVHWAHRVADEFPDGRLFVNLRGFDEGARVDAAEALTGFLTALGVSPQEIPAEIEAMTMLYRSVMGARRMIVVLDNAWSVDQVRRLVPGTPGSLVIVTSRQRLTGLAAQGDAHLITLELPTWEDARAAMRRRLGDERAAADPSAVDDLIAQCGRLPLAMTIVAARAASAAEPLSAVAAGLRSGGPTLDAFNGDEPAWDLRTVCSWSYGWLSADGARLFRLLGVHPGPDIGRGCIASLAGIEPRHAGLLVTELTLAGLLTEHRWGRYVLHDLVRLYAAELAAGPGRAAETRRATTRLVNHMQLTAQAADEMLMPPLSTRTVDVPVEGVAPETISDLPAAMAWFAAEMATIEHAVATLRVDGFRPWQLASTVVAYCQRVGAYHTWRTVAGAGLRAALDAQDTRGEAHMRRMLAGAEQHLGDPASAVDGLTRALALFERLDAKVEQGHVLRNLGWSYYLQGRFDRALDAYRRADVILARHGSTRDQALALTGIGYSLAGLTRHVEAIEHLRRAGRVFARVHDHNWQGSCEDALADIEHARGHLDESIRHRRYALRLFATAANPASHVESTVALGRTHLAAGRVEEGHQVLTAAAAAAESLHLTRTVTEIEKTLAMTVPIPIRDRP